ncbi:MAG: alpha/beta hydrolase [Alphaproteobacteria bacterium]|nr:alpha/beta hydrolase [Alphaproteobacteria bacterium]
MTAPAAIRFGYAQLPGIRLHYAAAGEASNPLMLFVHGFPEFWRCWQRQLPEFGRDHLAVAYDTRGYNLSDKPERLEDYAIEAILGDLKAMVGQFGHKSCILVGHDWGGAACWEFAIQYPELVEKLVILNAPHPALFRRDLQADPQQQKASEYMGFFRTPEAEAKIAADDFAFLWKFTFAGLHRKGQFSDQDREAYLEAWRRPGALTGGLNYYRGYRMRKDVLANSRVKVPTLVLWGMRDTALLPRLIEGLEDYVPDLRLVRLDEVTHWVTHQASDRVNREIRAFIGKP